MGLKQRFSVVLIGIMKAVEGLAICGLVFVVTLLPTYAQMGSNLSFANAVAYSSGGQMPFSVVVADVNGDSKPDLVVANWCATNSPYQCTGNGSGIVGVLLGNGDGTFQTAVPYSSGGIRAYSMAVADVNGDGKPDIVVANGAAVVANGTGVVSVLLGNGDGTFQTAVPYSSGAYGGAVSVAVADVNGDGKPDLLVLDYANAAYGTTSSTVGVLLGNGDGTFQSAVTYDSGGLYGTSLAVVDVNGDGKPDLLVTNDGCDTNCIGTVGVLLGNGNGTFQTAVTYASGGEAWSVAAADVNGDGKPDLLVANNGSATVSVLLGNGNGTFQTAVT